MKKVIKQLEDTMRFTEAYLTGDEDDPMEDIYKRPDEILAELKKMEVVDEKGN